MKFKNEKRMCFKRSMKLRYKLLIAFGSAITLFLIPHVAVYAIAGVDEYEAFLATQVAGLDGLIEYFKFLIELFELAVA